MTWPVDKTIIINDALALTGNQLVYVADDGSDEWNVASAGYELALSYMIESHDWKFASIVVPLAALPTPPSDDLFTTAFAKPADCLHIVWVRMNDTPVVYQILNNQIVLGDQYVDVSGYVTTLKYIRQPSPDQVTPTFMMAMRSFVMSALYRGLNDDPSNADRMWTAGEQFLASARTRSDQEQPKRAFFNSRAAMARRVRRPWSPSPPGWGGGGNPGS